MEQPKDSGLILRGVLTASNIKSGNRKEDGQAYALRINAISDGRNSFNHTETLDPSLVSEQKGRDLYKPVTIIVESARTEMGVTSVRGEIVQDNGAKAAPSDKS